MRGEARGTLQALCWLVVARALLAGAEFPAALRMTRRLAHGLIGRRGEAVSDEEGLIRVQRALMRASRLVPGADCKARAIAGRLWLAWGGVGGRVVVGFCREAGRWKGHAWVEVEEGGRLFMERVGGHRVVFDEERV
jgi:hypothetical protein